MSLWKKNKNLLARWLAAPEGDRDCGHAIRADHEGKTGNLLRASRSWHHGRQPDGQPEGGDKGDGPQGCQNRDEVPTSGNRFVRAALNQGGVAAQVGA